MVNSIDVAIAGGGPAGLAAAIAVRRKGLDVAVFEGNAADSPIDKCCGEGLMPDALDALRTLGIVLPPSAGFAIAGIRFLEGDHAAEARFEHQAGVGIRRTTLHSLLQEHARQAGVQIFSGAPVRGLASDGLLVGDDVVRCRWIVGADGSQSAMRRAAGLERSRKYSRRFGTRRHFRIAPWSDLVEIYWAQGAQAYATPVTDNEVGIAIISSDPRLRFDDALSRFPELAARVAGMHCTSTVRGAMTASLRLAKVMNGNLALVGDASGSLDAVTGLGLSLAFQQAAALAPAIAKGELPAYAAAHRRFERLPRLMETLMLTMDRHDWFRMRAIRALAADPAQFSRLLALHAGTLPPFSFALRVPLALGWRFFTA